MAEKTPDPRQRSLLSMPSKPSSSAAYTVGMKIERRLGMRIFESGETVSVMRNSDTVIATERPPRMSRMNVDLEMGDVLELTRGLSKRAREAAAAAVVLEPEKEVERLVWEYVKRMKEHNPSWKPETSKLGDGRRTFGDYWRAEPRDYEALAGIVRRVLSTAR